MLFAQAIVETKNWLIKKDKKNISRSKKTLEWIFSKFVRTVLYKYCQFFIFFHWKSSEQGGERGVKPQ